MVAKKKRATSDASVDMTTMTSPEDKAAAMQSNGTNSDGVSVDTIAKGQHEVNLLDLGISAEDIAAM